LNSHLVNPRSFCFTAPTWKSTTSSRRLAREPNFTAGVTETCKCDQGSRAHDWEIEDHDVVTAEKASLQKGMNYGVGKNYSVFLMSLRQDAPYADALGEVTGMLTYEGHDEPQRAGGPNPKEVDQPLTTPKGSSTENGKFFRAAMDFKSCFHERANSWRVIFVAVDSQR